MYISNKRKFLLLAFTLLSCQFVCGQTMFQTDSLDQKQRIFIDSVTPGASVRGESIYNPSRDSKRLLINTGVNLAMSVAKFGVLWLSPESFSLWDKEKIRKVGWNKSWKENVKAGPVKDDDCFFMNGIMHPLGGAIYYMSARGSGYQWWESFIYSGLLSTFMWEYGVEAFAEVPSWNDLIVTPVAGSLLGEGFFVLKRKIVENDVRIFNSRFIGRTALIIMDPVNEITDVVGYKTRHKINVSTSLCPVNIHDYHSSPIAMGVYLNIAF